VSDILTVEGLTKRFGGLLVSDAVDLQIRYHELHAIIGPNGAGKSTLVKQLQGELPADDGRIYFAGRDITSLPAHARARLGLARSFQITSVFPDLTVLQNVALALQAHQGHSFQFWQQSKDNKRQNATALATLERVGLAGHAGNLAGRIAYSEQRQLEFAMALAVEPQLLLLDEPMAGMSKDESEHIVELMQTLKGTVSIVLIEHDMDAVFALADRISVLVHGRVIACGPPDTIRADPAVRHAYLGEEP
jgi:branched-chain amino acid transport system ATP-binding protein